MKYKSSVILQQALILVKSGEQRFACAAIQDVETTLRFEHQENIVSKAAQIFGTFRPKTIPDNMKDTQPWWPNGDIKRIEALEAAINIALKRMD